MKANDVAPGSPAQGSETGTDERASRVGCVLPLVEWGDARYAKFLRRNQEKATNEPWCGGTKTAVYFRGIIATPDLGVMVLLASTNDKGGIDARFVVSVNKMSRAHLLHDRRQDDLILVRQSSGPIVEARPVEGLDLRW